MAEQIMRITPDDDKWSIRNGVWNYIETNDLANFPRPVKNRIPNVVDADKAANRLTTLPAFQSAQVIKINPDKPQEQARFNTLELRKTLLVPTPRLRQGLFNKIIPPADVTKEILRICSTSQGIKEYSKPLSLEDNVKVDLVVLGSVAVSKKGWRIGKGEGYADLEYAMMASLGAVNPNTLVITTVHDCQVFDELPDHLFGPHDVTVDFIVTPTRVIECVPRMAKPKGIIWSMLTREKLRAVPILKQMRRREEAAGVDVTLKDGMASGSDEEVGHSGAEGDNLGRGARRKQRQARSPQAPLPGIFVGRFPSSLRASELKTQVREQGVHPVRIIWRGGKRHAFLLFDTREKAEDALNTLEGMEIDGKEVKVEMANERSDRSENEDSDRSPRGGQPQRRRPSNRRRRQESEESTPTKSPRRQRKAAAGPGVWIGNLPRNLKVSDFKQMVRQQDVQPVRVIWRGRVGYSILQFETQSVADRAVDVLGNFTINDRELKIAPSNSRPPPRSDGEVTEESDADRPPAPRRMRRPRGAPRTGQRSGPESGDDDEARGSNRRRPRRQICDTAVYVGNLPKSVRISEFKARVRENDVQAARVIWRGNNHHAFLMFEKEDQAHEALKLLKGLSIQDNELDVQCQTRSQTNGQQVNGDHSE